MKLANSSKEEEFLIPTSTLSQRVIAHDIQDSKAEVTEEEELEAVWDKETPSLLFILKQPSFSMGLPASSMGGRALLAPHPTPILVPLPGILRTLCSQTRNPLDSIQHFDFGPFVGLPSLTVHRPSWQSQRWVRRKDGTTDSGSQPIPMLWSGEEGGAINWTRATGAAGPRREGPSGHAPAHCLISCVPAVEGLVSVFSF